jgi:hypothetical protein
VKDSYPWDSGFVAEGMNILPRLVARDFKDDASVKAIFLADDNVQRMHDVIFTRGLWDDSGSYPDNLKDKEVAWATLFNSKLKQEAEEFGFPVVHVHKNDEDLREVLNALDAGQEIEKGSAYEVELRASVVWAIEWMRQELSKRAGVEIQTAAINDGLWLKGGEVKTPFHKVRTTAN